MSDHSRNDVAVVEDGDQLSVRWPLLGPALFIILQLIALLFITRTFPLEIVLAIEGALGGILGISLLFSPPRLPAIGGYLLTASISGAVVVWGLASDLPLYLVALGLSLVLVTLMYGLHRYQRVRLGLVSTPDQKPKTSEADR